MIAKRLVDVVGAAVALVVLAPVLAVVAVLVRLRLGSPVLFRQERAGLGGRPFVLTKLRTMTDERGADGELHLTDATTAELVNICADCFRYRKVHVVLTSG